MLDEAEWEQREVQLVSCIKKNEEEKESLEKEIKILLYLLKETEEEQNAKREEKAQLKEKLTDSLRMSISAVIRTESVLKR